VTLAPRYLKVTTWSTLLSYYYFIDIVYSYRRCSVFARDTLNSLLPNDLRARALSYFLGNIRMKSPGDRSCCISRSCFACISEFDSATRISVNPFRIDIPRRFTLCARRNQSRRIARRDSQRENEAVAEREGANQGRNEWMRGGVTATRRSRLSHNDRWRTGVTSVPASSAERNCHFFVFALYPDFVPELQLTA